MSFTHLEVEFVSFYPQNLSAAGVNMEVVNGWRSKESSVDS